MIEVVGWELMVVVAIVVLIFGLIAYAFKVNIINRVPKLLRLFILFVLTVLGYLSTMR